MKIALLAIVLAALAAVLAYFGLKAYVDNSIERMRLGDYARKG